MAVHLVNLKLSLELAIQGRDQCQVYLTAILIDVTVGVILVWFLVRFFDIFFEKMGWTSLVSGNYFILKKVNRKREYFISLKRWTAQCFIWCLIASFVKSCF